MVCACRIQSVFCEPSQNVCPTTTFLFRKSRRYLTYCLSLLRATNSVAGSCCHEHGPPIRRSHHRSCAARTAPCRRVDSCAVFASIGECGLAFQTRVKPLYIPFARLSELRQPPVLTSYRDAPVPAGERH